ncbi:MAG: acetyl-CoA carboxylase biotin carboxylase subunit [Alphaproteobacteria bacterium]|nr:acetyl-CoA carboxylase biotin carboxylase subunit [Alphaproteobacteria bacterium]
MTACSNDISTVLIANRGEIALRILRTAKTMGLKTVAVYSDADAEALHVKFADAAVRIGPPPVGESYLSADAILAAAKTSGATAIHPGYGFLSENAKFAQAVADAGLTFIGPPPSAIDAMGDKARAKRRMIGAGIPCVPGYEGENQSEKVFSDAAAKTGYPVMVKAAAGGGGRGMRLVEKAEDLPAALKLARSEAQNAFGNGDLILEKAILRPRHVEVQVFGDTHGNMIHLGERDCSVQRRHQKIIEEAPCPVMTPELRRRMGEAAVNVARTVGYVGAGTVEFLLDEVGRFYFLEMNTRLQVEHPVTEMITGLDLVALQFRVAHGEKLGLSQQDIRLDGHAMEVRLYAEEPEAGFLPSTGDIHLFRMPDGEGVRVDAGVATGAVVSPFYDAMIAKLIAHGATRDEARQRLVAALSASAVFGPHTNRDFLIDTLQQPAFADGKATTAFIGDTYGDKFAPPPAPDTLLAAAAVVQHACALLRAKASTLSMTTELLDWSSATPLQTIVEYETAGSLRKISVRPKGRQAYNVTVGDKRHDVSVAAMDGETVRFLIDGQTLSATYREDGRTVFLATPQQTLEFTNLVSFIRPKTSTAGLGVILAPMHGKLVDICVKEGASVKRGDRLAVLEAMKMQHELTAEVDGRVARVAAEAGSQIAVQSLILEIEPNAEPTAAKAAGEAA